jgi:hypothetical protein
MILTYLISKNTIPITQRMIKQRFLKKNSLNFSIVQQKIQYNYTGKEIKE